LGVEPDRRIDCAEALVAASLHNLEEEEIFEALGVELEILATLVPIVENVVLRRGFSLRPKLTAVIGGLACASAAATLLNFVHPYDAAATDLAVHGLAVTIVILANILFGGRLLSGEMNRSGFIG
jgi:heme/copper-type cytochrome/quinol oxidase subunit 4